MHVVRLLRYWWRSDPDYAWLTQFLASRGVANSLRYLIGACGAVLGVVTFTASRSSVGSDSGVLQLISLIIVVGAAAWTARWWLRGWPSPRGSLVMLAAADVGIGVGCLLDTVAIIGLAGTTVFVLTGAYAVFFHTARAQAAHLAFAVATIAVLGAEAATGPDGDPMLAITKVLISLLVVVGIIPIIHFGFWLLSTDAVDSLTDPLTGLLNRRGLVHQLEHLLSSAPPPITLCAIVIDLDDFKAVNDNWGHAVGDELLALTAGHIRASVRATAVIARLGGEEFAVLDTVDHATGCAMADRIRRAIAASTVPAPITASIGVVADTLSGRTTEGLDSLLVRADDAMYQAKQAGGNRISRPA